MARMPLSEKTLLRVMCSASGGQQATFYPIVLAITLEGTSREIRIALENLAEKGEVLRYKSKIPFVSKIFGCGYALNNENNL